MKTLMIISVLFISFAFHLAGQTYNKALADSLGADEFGMKQYVLVILKTGNYKPGGKEETDSLFQGHMDNINHLVKEGKMIVAGPLEKNDQHYRGIFILNVNTIDKAKKLLSTDPTIASNVFEAETYIWFGSAALPTYLKTHSLIEKQKH